MGVGASLCPNPFVFNNADRPGGDVVVAAVAVALVAAAAAVVVVAATRHHLLLITRVCAYLYVRAFVNRALKISEMAGKRIFSLLHNRFWAHFSHFLGRPA